MAQAFPEEMRHERKVVTCVDVDIAGSTVIGERFAPDEVRQIIPPAIATMTALVEEWGGWVKDLAGDGILALFGARQAHEDDPERAVRAGMAIVEAMRRHADEVRQRWGLENFNVRVGVETGLAVVGAVGAGGRVEYGATGEAVSVAAQLQTRAEPFGITAGPGAHRALGSRFEWSDAFEMKLRDRVQPVLARHVRGEGIVSKLHDRGVRGMAAPLVGRAHELSEIGGAVGRLGEGRGDAIVLIGDAGLGKSRLLVEVRERTASAGVVEWLEGSGVSYGAALPYFPIRDVVRNWLGITVMDSPEELDARLRSRLGELLDSPDDTLHHLQAMLGLPLEAAVDAELAALSAEARRYQIAQAMRRVVVALAERRPVVLVIEDLHWVDGSSLELVQELAELRAELPVLLVASHRPEMGHPSWNLHSALESAGGARVLKLTPLPADAEAQMLDAMVGEGVIAGAFRDRLLATVEGNPLYLEEVVRSLVDGGSLVRDGDTWRLAGSSEIEIPPTVERVVVSRMDRLSPRARDSIHVASVLGRQFGEELLAAVGGPEVVSQEALGELIALEFFREETPGSRTYRFKHALIQDAAYNNLLRKRRRELHLRAAESIQTLLAETITLFYGVIAHHYRRAEYLAEALTNYELAAAESQRVYAVAAALENFSAALELAEKLGRENAEDLRLSRGLVHAQAGDVPEARADFEQVVAAAAARSDDHLEARATNELGFIMAGAVSYEQALPLLERALELAKSGGFADVEVAAAARLSTIYTNMLRLDLGVERAEVAHSLAAAAPAGTVAMALDARQLVSVLVGDMVTAEDVSSRLVDIHRRHADLWYLQFALFQWAWVDMAASRWDAAESRLAEGLAVNRTIADRGNEPLFTALISWVARARGDYTRAIALGVESVEATRALGHREFESLAGELLAWTYLDVFAYSDALAEAERAYTAANEAGAKIEIVRAVCLTALLRFLNGDPVGAEDARREAMAVLDAVRAPAGHAFLQGADGPVALAHLHIARGEYADALALALPVVAAARRDKWYEMLAIATYAAGCAHAANGDRDAADAALREALDVATTFDLPSVQWRASARLADLMQTTEPGAAADFSATARQRVDLIAAALDPSRRETFVNGAATVLAARHPA